MVSSACCVASSARSVSRRILCATAWSRSPAATARLAKASSSPCCARPIELGYPRPSAVSAPGRSGRSYGMGAVEVGATQILGKSDRDAAPTACPERGEQGKYIGRGRIQAKRRGDLRERRRGEAARREQAALPAASTLDGGPSTITSPWRMTTTRSNAARGELHVVRDGDYRPTNGAPGSTTVPTALDPRDPDRRSVHRARGSRDPSRARRASATSLRREGSRSYGLVSRSAVSPTASSCRRRGWRSAPP